MGIIKNKQPTQNKMRQTFYAMLGMASLAASLSLNRDILVGKPIGVFCSNDEMIHVCNEGAYRCHDDGLVCEIEEGITGFRTEITCDNDGSKHICGISTRWCYDNSPEYCPEKLQLAQTTQEIIVGGLT